MELYQIGSYLFSEFQACIWKLTRAMQARGALCKRKRPGHAREINTVGGWVSQSVVPTSTQPPLYYSTHDIIIFQVQTVEFYYIPLVGIKKQSSFNSWNSSAHMHRYSIPYHSRCLTMTCIILHPTVKLITGRTDQKLLNRSSYYNNNVHSVVAGKELLYILLKMSKTSMPHTPYILYIYV